MKTKTIRIAVAMEPDGSDWTAMAAPRSDDENANSAVECMSNRANVHFVTAEIPLPEDIIGVVEPS